MFFLIFFFKKSIHIKCRKKQQKASNKNNKLKQHRIYTTVLTIYCYLIIFVFSEASLCCVMCFWVEQRFLSFTLWPHTRFVSWCITYSLILLHTCLGKPKMYLCVWVSCSWCSVHELACHMNAIVVFTSVRNAWCRGVETNCLGLFQKAV